MKIKTNLDQIMRIISGTKITGKNSFSVFGKQYNARHKSPYYNWPYDPKKFGSNIGIEEESELNLESYISDIIYRQFYSIGDTENEAQKINPELVPGYIDRKILFIKTLSEANQNTIEWDPYWTVTGFDGEKAIIQKNEFVKLLKPGMYVIADEGDTIAVGSRVHLKEPLEDDSIQPVFFYIFGAATLQDGIDTLRFYFNMKPDGAAHLIFHLSTLFNKYLIPFSFKCLNEAGWYSRTDNAVLYIDKRFHTIAGDVLQLVYNEIYPWVNTKTPLFTKKLANGLGFAEDPGYGQSFGDTRCAIITKLIIKNSGSEKKLSRTQVKNAFIERGFDIEKLYLNQYSKMEYPYTINEPEA